jgi:hypothetical protein
MRLTFGSSLVVAMLISGAQQQRRLIADEALLGL